MVGRKSTEEFWSSQYRGGSLILRLKGFLRAVPYYHFELRRLLRESVPFSEGKRLIEIGCAPGGYLVLLNKWFGVEVAGVEYSEPGCRQTERTFVQAGIEGEVIHADFFDAAFLKKHAARFDYVFSKGFIEHFDDVEGTVNAHFRLVKKGGYVICQVPNLQGLNRLLTEKRVLAIHNLGIMSLPAMRKLFRKHGRILFLGYCGGLFNWGAFRYGNKAANALRILLHLLQAFTVDQLFKLFLLVGVRLRWRYSSPSIMVVVKK